MSLWCLLSHAAIASRTPFRAVFLAAYFMQDPKNRAQSGVRFGLEVASSQAMHGGLWRAPFTAATSAFELAIVWYCVNEV